ncbi:MAG: hypothetical protein NE327_07815 [Lentisphaeraceae bacterium]|nr:hypothetical protein [Lentisphaeraceae bacterium]
MKNTSLILTAIILCFTFSSIAEDIEISKKEKKQLINIFQGKVKKPVVTEDTKNAEEAKFKEEVRKREAEMQAKLQNMTKEEREKFKKEQIKRRQAVKEKLQNMTKEERRAFLRELNKKKSEK